jgi:hypothetical protein
MKKTFILPALLLAFTAGFSQFAAKMEVKEPIPGLCNDKEVYVIFPMFKGQEEAKCPLTDKEVTNRLKEEVVFLKDSSGFTGKGMVNIIINCKGEVVKCEIDTKTGNAELDKQIVAVFNSLGQWKPGKLNGKKVDTARLWSFEINKGEIILE